VKASTNSFEGVQTFVINIYLLLLIFGNDSDTTKLLFCSNLIRGNMVRFLYQPGFDIVNRSSWCPFGRCIARAKKSEDTRRQTSRKERKGQNSIG
jgi:hypothetical protein